MSHLDSIIISPNGNRWAFARPPRLRGVASFSLLQETDDITNDD